MSFVGRQILNWLWRLRRNGRLLVCLLFICSGMVLINVVSPSIKFSSASRDFINRGILSSRQLMAPYVELAPSDNQGPPGHPKPLLPMLLRNMDKDHQNNPSVDKELSSGVREEENSAREVLDGEGNEKDGWFNFFDFNAANEVNSVEPETKIGSGNFHNWRNLSKKEIDKLSVLGRRLYLNENVGREQNRNFTILVWKYGPNVEKRLIREYGKEKKDPFARCSVHNCELTYKDEAITTADAVMIHLHRTEGPQSFPKRTNLNQRWIWLTDESPYYTFYKAKDTNMSSYNGYFNWSMSYRMDSDIPVPYGRTIELTELEASSYQYFDYFNNKSKTVATMGSNCGGRNKRWSYIKELQKHMEVDTYGSCGSLKCPGHFMKDCSLLAHYKFYLSFENSDCREYITEKVWWNALSKGSVPVVMGGPKEYYKKMLPPNSFIYVNDFGTPEDLAKYLMSLASNHDAYMTYHKWRKRFRIVNEHGYFATPVYHYCRICEALNYNSPEPKTYNKMEVFWNKDQCIPTVWQDKMNLKLLTEKYGAWSTLQHTDTKI